ncbi:MAG: hypothetical protein M1547_02015 [Gammaproteobacteria bacterium]|nr:hypothetical protein [Gammaproteobacteria bacterium]
MIKQKDYSACEQEVLAAVGELLVSQLAGRDELARAIFGALVPRFMGRYPHHKILTHIVLGQIEEERGETYLPNLPEKL